MLDFNERVRVGELLRKHLDFPHAHSLDAAALFDSDDLNRLVQIDEEAAAVPADKKDAAKAEASKLTQQLVDSTHPRSRAAKAAAAVPADKKDAAI